MDLKFCENPVKLRPLDGAKEGQTIIFNQITNYEVEHEEDSDLNYKLRFHPNGKLLGRKAELRKVSPSFHTQSY